MVDGIGQLALHCIINYGTQIVSFFFMESIFNVKVATNMKKEAKKIQRQKTFFCPNTTWFYSVQWQCVVLYGLGVLFIS